LKKNLSYDPFEQIIISDQIKFQLFLENLNQNDKDALEML